MADINKSDINQFLNDPELVDGVVNAVVSDQSVMADLAGDIADELSDVIEDDPTFKQKIIQAALAKPEFKQQIVRALINELD